MASSLSMPYTVMGQFHSWLPLSMLLKFVLEGNPIAHCIIMEASAP